MRVVVDMHGALASQPPYAHCNFPFSLGNTHPPQWTQPQGGHMTTCGELHSSSWNVYFGESKEKGAKWYEVTDFRGCLSHGSWTPMQGTGWSAEPPALPAFPAAQGAYSLPANCTGLGPAGQFQTTCGTYTHLAQALGLGGLG